jgi:hypothetical protein
MMSASTTVVNYNHSCDLRFWPTSADLRVAPKSSAYLRYYRRAGRTAAIAVVDPRRKSCGRIYRAAQDAKVFQCDIERHAPDLIGRVGDELANGSLPWAVTPDELTDALRRAGILRNGRVVEVTADALRTTVLSRVGRLHLRYEGATDGAPSSVFIKTGQPERAEQRWQGYRREVDFYTNVAPKMPSGVVPTCLDAQFDEATRNWRLVLEDLTDTHGLLKTPWPLPPSIEESKLLLSTWAGFHAAWWDSEPAIRPMVLSCDPLAIALTAVASARRSAPI